MNYYEELNKIDYFRLHPSHLPFIGENFEKYKILQISESHYYDGISDYDRFGIYYFKNWFTEPCIEVETDICKNITIDVCEKVMNNEYRFGNFDNPLRSFCRVVLGMAHPVMSKYNHNRRLYSHFAFMNFYQVPAFRSGGCFQNTFYSETKRLKINNPEEIIEQWRSESTDLVSKVIEILEPSAIVFTSIDAWESYDNHSGEFKDDSRIIRAAHPNRPWYRKQRKLGDKTPKQVFEEELQRIYF